MSKTIKQNLADGIKNKDWKAIVEAYETLTGEKMSVADNADHIFTIKSKVKKHVMRPSPSNEEESNEDNEQKVVCRTEDITKAPKFNMWYDDGKEAANDKKFDRLAKPENLTQKGGRQAFRLVKTTCSRCKKNFETHPDSVKGFICNKCSSGLNDN